MDIDMKVELIHGFSNKMRLQILESLMTGEKMVSQIIDDLKASQSSVSQHLACLKGCGLILSRQEGKYVYYRIRNEQIHDLIKMFDDVLLEVQNDIRTCESHIS